MAVYAVYYGERQFAIMENDALMAKKEVSHFSRAGKFATDN
jgi:hypothetical protein